MMHIGSLVAGPRGTIADVAGVTVGHCTLAQGAVQTGVTVIRPHDGDVYRHKVPAAACVINGFGKSVGLVQVDELGTLDTPIALTHTFGVGAVAQAQIRAAIAATTIVHLRQTFGPATCSIGLATSVGDRETPQQLLQAADAALYRAKAEGRDRVVDGNKPAAADA